MPTELWVVIVQSVVGIATIAGAYLTTKRAKDVERGGAEFLLGAESVQKLRSEFEKPLAELRAELGTERRARQAAEAEAESYSARVADLEEHVDRLEKTVRLQNVGMAILDREEHYLFVDAVGADMNGKTIDDHIGRRVSDLFPEFREQIVPLVQRVMGNRETVMDVVTSADPRGGPGRLVWSVEYSPIVRPTDGFVLGMLGRFKLVENAAVEIEGLEA